ncbi:MAG TPA: type II toxin-antitoxin system HicB family antitoxin [Acidobacteriaceae bacterium]
MKKSNTSAELSLTIVFKEAKDDTGTYFVAECLELPGCVSQGDTQEEARQNIEDAMRLCLSVVFEDCLKQMMCRQSPPDLRGISSQDRLTIDPTPHLQYA